MLSTTIPNIIGLFGVFCVLSAYIFLQICYWSSKDLIFSFTNLLGSICILFSLLFNWNLSSVVIELAWLLISIYGVISGLKSTFLIKRKKSSHPFSQKSLKQDREQNFIPLSLEEIQIHLHELGFEWKVINGKYLQKDWIFDSYQKSIDFVNEVSKIAEYENHHPDFVLGYKKATLTITTHNINALTKADYILAAKISEILV